MANRLAFHYCPLNSPLHHWDARCKLAGLLVVTIGLLHANTGGLSLFSMLFAAAAGLSRLPWRRIFSDLKGWWVILLIIFILKAFSETGDPLSPPPLPWLPMSRSGLVLGSVTCWRLALILGYSALFTAVTRHREFQEALTWLLGLTRIIPARRTAFMVALTIRFLPLILDQSDEVRLAFRSRMGERCRNPIRIMKFMALPLIRRTFSRADELAMALAARGYRDDLPLHLPGIPRGHAAALLALIAVVAAAFYFPKISQISWTIMENLA